MVDLWTSLLYSYPPITIDAASRVSSIIDLKNISEFLFLCIYFYESQLGLKDIKKKTD